MRPVCFHCSLLHSFRTAKEIAINLFLRKLQSRWGNGTGTVIPLMQAFLYITSVIIQMLCLVLYLNNAIYLHNSYEVSIVIILILQTREQTLRQDLNKRLLF